ncbi:MAG: hypothetical protein AWM53_01103 [Candidatus Dichloromethanomonas elyunquensis]|nr:MAG: hypothetical protein AWM53_01103 [Candidatus Dichloromethanomonas elyunquensis]
MNSLNLVSKLKQLTDEGEALLRSGLENSANAGEISTPVFNWLLKCNRFLSTHYGNDSTTVNEFKKAYTIPMSIRFLVSLAASEQRLNDISVELSSEHFDLFLQQQEMQIYHSLEFSVQPNNRTAASDLFRCIQKEAASLRPDWNLVSSLLKKGFDYSISYGSEMAQYANAVFNEEKRKI